MSLRELDWNPPQPFAGCELRTARFIRKSAVPLARAAAAAGEIAVRARELLELALPVEIFPPVGLEPSQWNALCEDALLYRVCGERAEGALLLGLRDAELVARHAFGETASCGEGLSELESRVVDRFVMQLAGALDPLFGRARIECGGRSAPCASFVEVRLGAPLGAAIGLGIACDPKSPPGPKLAPAALDGCVLECSARLEAATIQAMKLITLGIGDVLQLSSQGGPAATLNVDLNPIATGEGGIVGDLLAFMVHDVQSGMVGCPR